MTKGKVWGKKTWHILLGILCVVIVGLAIGLIFIWIRGTRIELEHDKKDDEEVVSEILDIIRPMSIEDTQNYLDEQLEVYKNTDLVSSIWMMKINAFVNAGLFEDAILMSHDIDIELLNDSERLNFYSALNKAYIGIGDFENADYYSKEFADLYYKIIGEIEDDDL